MAFKMTFSGFGHGTGSPMNTNGDDDKKTKKTGPTSGDKAEIAGEMVMEDAQQLASGINEYGIKPATNLIKGMASGFAQGAKGLIGLTSKGTKKVFGK